MSPELVLIDTSAWISALAKTSLPEVKSRIAQLLKENRVAINNMIRLELLGGTKSAIEFTNLKSRLDALHQLGIGNGEWEEAAKLAFELRRQGKTIPLTDILIATTAIRAGASLLHADQHFDLIAQNSDLVAESVFHFVSRANP